MDKLQILLILIGVVQLILGAMHLFAPTLIYTKMGMTAPPEDNHYYGGMMAARFIAYGIGMFVIAQAPQHHVFWIYNMILVQIIDLLVGLFYTARGVITLKSSGFPMFNATLFIILLSLWAPAYS